MTAALAYSPGMRRVWAGLLSVAIAFSGIAAAQGPTMPERAHDSMLTMDCASLAAPLPERQGDCDDTALCAAHCLSVPFMLAPAAPVARPSILKIAAVIVDVRAVACGQAPPLPPPRT